MHHVYVAVLPASQLSVSETSESAAGDMERPAAYELAPSQSQAVPGTSQSGAEAEGEAHSAQFMLQPLSMQLELEELWETLSRCLDALAKTHDPHAVLVLQLTVEAFFLVHTDHSEEGKQATKKPRSRTGRLSSFHTISDTESNPASPAPHPALSPIPSTPGLSEVDFDPYSHLPPDAARFLKFAGM